MADFTRRAIKETFLKLLQEHPLNEITVKVLTQTCGINRNSFYYHYHDIPTLIEEIISEEAERIIEKYPSVNSMVECFDAITDFASHNKRAIMHIYRSVSREVFEKNLMDMSRHFMEKYIETVLEDEIINEQDKRTVIDYYKCVCFGLTIDWLNHGMDDEYARSVRRIFLIKKDLNPEIAQFLQEQIEE